MIANLRRPGAASRKISSLLLPVSANWVDRPVTLPPGRARLATRPVPSGSAATANTIGITDVACLTTRAATPDVTMTSTLSLTNSAAISAKRSLRPSPQRYSMVTVRPSIQPSSRSRCTKAVTDLLWPEGVDAPRNPIVGTFAGCCARAASGHTAPAPPSRLMKSGRFIFAVIRSPRRRRENRRRNFEPQHFGSLEIDHEFVLGRRLHRKVGGLLALEDAIDVTGSAPELVDEIGTVGAQAAAGDVETAGKDRGELVPCRHFGDQLAMDDPQCASRHDQAAIRPCCECRHGALDFAGIAHVERSQLHAQCRRDDLHRAKLPDSRSDGRIAKHRHPRHAGRDLLEQLQPFPAHAEFVDGEPGRVAAPMCQARD